MEILDGQNLIWLLLGGAVFFLALRYLTTRVTSRKNSGGADQDSEVQANANGNSADSIRDPVCGMRVDTNTDITWIHEGQVYYFCSMSCRGRFRTEPEKFLRSVAVISRTGESSTKT